VPPDGCIDIEFHTGNNYEFSFDEQTFSTLPSKAVIMGLTKNVMLNKNISGGTTIGVKFLPYGARTFLKAPIHEFVNQVVDVKEIWKKRGRYLEDKILNAGNPIIAVEMLQEFLIDVLTKANLIIDNVSKDAVNMIIESGGNIKVIDIYRKLCLSERQLERKFKNFIGLEPKLFSKIVRFNYVLDYIFVVKKISFPDTAQRFGYYDQSHLTRDVKLFTGMTPDQYFKSYLFTNKQNGVK
jgi:AraC-like DNA-binding protein